MRACLRPARARRSLSAEQTTSAGPNRRLCQEGYDAGWRPIAPCVFACRGCCDGHRSSGGPRPRSAPTNSRPIRIVRSRTGGRCRRAGPGVRPARSESIPTAAASGSPSGAANSLPPSQMKPGGAVRAATARSLTPILKFDPSGKLLKSFGAGSAAVPARPPRRPRGQCLGHRRPRPGRQGSPGVQVQLPTARC